MKQVLKQCKSTCKVVESHHLGKPQAVYMLPEVNVQRFLTPEDDNSIIVIVGTENSLCSLALGLLWGLEPFQRGETGLVYTVSLSVEV